MDVLKTQTSEKFDQVYVENFFTFGTIIRFITTCTYFILSFIFGIVDISNFFINLVKVSKFDFKKMLALHYRMEGVALSLSLLSLMGLPLTRILYTEGLYGQCVIV